MLNVLFVVSWLRSSGVVTRSSNPMIFSTCWSGVSTFESKNFLASFLPFRKLKKSTVHADPSRYFIRYCFGIRSKSVTVVRVGCVTILVVSFTPSWGLFNSGIGRSTGSNVDGLSRFALSILCPSHGNHGRVQHRQQDAGFYVRNQFINVVDNTRR